MNAAQSILLILLRAYQCTLSPLLAACFGPMGFGCRFTPTCSQYALDAVRAHGAIRGSWLTLRRLGRCHPWGRSGIDPVPTNSTQLACRETEEECLKVSSSFTAGHASRIHGS